MSAKVCENCMSSEKVIFRRRYKKYFCKNCLSRFNYAKKIGFANCTKCQQFSRVSLSEGGQPVCNNCYRAFYAKKMLCHGCQKLRQLCNYRKTGVLLCSTCRGRLRYKDVDAYENCACCNERKPVASRTSYGESICYNCYISKGFR